MVKPTITTGLEALGRGNDSTKLKRFLENIVILGEDVVAQRLNIDDVIKRFGTAEGIDMGGLIKSEADIQAETQQAQMMAMIQKLGPNAINQVGGIARDQMDPANAAQGQEAPGGGGAAPSAPPAV